MSCHSGNEVLHTTFKMITINGGTPDNCLITLMSDPAVVAKSVSCLGFKDKFLFHKFPILSSVS